MNGKQKLKTACAHQSGPLCLDLGSTAVTGIHVKALEGLRRHYGLAPRPAKVCEPYQMLGDVEDDLQRALGIDTVAMPPPNTIFGFRNDHWREFRLPWGQDVLVSAHFQTTTDANGDLLIYPKGDRAAPPSGRMPTGGYFFDTIVRQEPIVEENLDPADNLEEFGLLGEADCDYFRAEARRLADTTQGVVATFPGTAFGDIALVPAPFLPHPKGIRDIAEWYMATVMRQDYVHAIFTRQCELALKNLASIHAIVGNLVDAVFLCGTDFGTQTSQFCSTATFDSLYAPYYRQINAWIHAHTGWKCFKHSCGAVEPFISRFIDCGFDILNPVQCSATGMDPATLKARYGGNIVFWGGGVDTQKTLPFGKPAEVREQVLRRCELFAHNGGFVFNPIHNIQANTPVPNVVAMFEAIREFRG